jgi:catechol 2,3-dioxygenase-like lactoylglutathione lyase family enzyme
MGIFLPACRKEDLDPLEYPSVSLKIRELGIRVEDMNASRVFWTETLGFPLLSLTANEFVVQIGSSRLSFRPKNTTNPPVYHFSINIPQNQVENALDWLKHPENYVNGPSQAIEIITDELSGAEIINKPLYNANSVFFKDNSGNIVELIARNELENSVEGDFGREQFLRISEVSVVTKEVRECEEILNTEFGAKAFPRTTSGYKPVGGVEGVVLLVVPGRPWIPTQSLVAEQYDTVITIEDTEEKEFMLPGVFPAAVVTVKTEV